MTAKYDRYDLEDPGRASVPGFEGSGIVVLSGGGIVGQNLIGKRVAFHIDSKDYLNSSGCY